MGFGTGIVKFDHHTSLITNFNGYQCLNFTIFKRDNKNVIYFLSQDRLYRLTEN